MQSCYNSIFQDIIKQNLSKTPIKDKGKALQDHTENPKDHILVIKLGALGDFIQALGPMGAIRKHHPDAHITLLTTAPFKSFGEKSQYFDEIWIDKKPRAFDLRGWLSLMKHLTSVNFSRVYDLQNNDRTSLYFKLFPVAQRPEWVGVAKGASYRNTSPERTAGHAFDGHKQTLGLVGIKNVTVDDLSWIKEDLSDFPLRAPYILLVPGSTPQHPHKRWPAENYAALSSYLIKQGYQVVLLGTAAEKDVTDTIINSCPDLLNLTGKTSLFQIAALAQNAYAAIGNDTGPMHIIGPTGCPTLVLFSGRSTPHRHAPKGANTITVQEQNLKELSVERVINTLHPTLNAAARSSSEQ